MPTMDVHVVSAERLLYSGEATEVYGRTPEGEIGILPGHQPALLALTSSPVRVKSPEGDEVVVAVHHGFLEFRENDLTVLADIAELAVDIDVERAKAARNRAIAHKQDPDYPGDADAELERAELRLRIAEGYYGPSA
jgi:F-type H+-transporting ATPase subunit epsilon